ncbi:hypothetical protein [Photobacterium sp. BZF1]|nr:hypothetical protein [Photobacterium sp. BZF1]
MNMFGSAVDIAFRVGQTGIAGVSLFIIVMTFVGAGIARWLGKD